ncbi:MAG: transglutaminase-like cysteine peptidase, partial [Campylobacterota bacterium]|nr:transglutaminase-like cysteine peptidase [Campylobacterota bacterium]
SAKTKTTIKKLKTVNDFFNKIRYMSDRRVWKRKDYWASPFEFLGRGAGDCEDFAIAKYFALRAVGVPENKLKITYVKLKRLGTRYEEAHMVLNYYDKPNSTPIILDNVNKKLKLATKRKDLKPIYSFNASGLWAAQNKTKDLKHQGDNKLKKWQSMMSRI